MSDAMPGRLRIHEGSIGVPAGFADRTANLFVPDDPARQPNLSIARDHLAPGETLDDYVGRQLAQLKARMPGHALLARMAERLGPDASLLHGVGIETRHRAGAHTVRQRQAVFDIGAGRLLIFSAAAPAANEAGLDTLWRAWLDSFQLAD